MARRWSIGFELGGPRAATGGDHLATLRQWDGELGVGGGMSLIPGRLAGSAVRLVPGADVTCGPGAPLSQGTYGILRAAVRISALPNQRSTILSNYPGVELSVNPDGSLDIGGFPAKKAGFLTPGQWSVIEVARYWSRSEHGCYFVRVDGALTYRARVGPWTGDADFNDQVDLSNTGVSSAENGMTVDFDDLCFNDSTGDHQNAWPGDGQVKALLPTVDISSAGTVVPATPYRASGGSATAPFYECLNNTPPQPVFDGDGADPGVGGSGPDYGVGTEISFGSPGAEVVVGFPAVAAASVVQMKAVLASTTYQLLTSNPPSGHFALHYADDPEPGVGDDGYVDFSSLAPGATWASQNRVFVVGTTYGPPSSANVRIATPAITIPSSGEWVKASALAQVYELATEGALPPSCGWMAWV